MSASPGGAALVTGAASGIGAAAMAALRAAGLRVVGLDIAPGPDIVPADLGSEAQVVAAVARAAALLGRIDVLVNCAGIELDAPLGEQDAASFDRMMAVNVRAPMLVAREALPHLADGGCIVNIASELAYLGRTNASAYCATKAAILALTRSWAREELEHASLLETPLMLLLRPELVEMDKAPADGPARFPAYDRWPDPPGYLPPSGVLARAELATAEKGQWLMDDHVALIAAAVRQGFGLDAAR